MRSGNFLQRIFAGRSKDELSASLILAALMNQPQRARNLVSAGANVHVDFDRPLLTAGNLGHLEVFSSLLKFYDPARDAAAMNAVRSRLQKLTHREDFVALLNSAIGRSNVLPFAPKSSHRAAA